MKDGPPTDDAYERVTNPERFLVLHQVAEELVARLESGYEVEIRPGGSPDERVIRQVELAPLVGAPISISWDDFPGLTVRVGRWHEESYPQCGCDACDEGPAELVEELLRQVETVVAGKFIEAVVSDADGVWLTFEILAPDGRVSGKRLLRDGHPALKYPGEIRWPAWPSSAVPTK